MCDVLAQRPLELVQVGPGRAEHLTDIGIRQKGEQKVLDGEHVVVLVARLHEGGIQGFLQFIGEHQASSITVSRGC